VEQKTKVLLKKGTVMDSGTSGQGQKEEEKKFRRQDVEDLEDPEMFHVMLLDDTDYTQEHVCKALMDIVEEIQIKEAEGIYKETKNGGVARICTTSQELGEFYVEQLARSEPMIFCELKEA
jgi:ATP-dependent Clp protease adapter protein ClpS